MPVLADVVARLTDVVVNCRLISSLGQMLLPILADVTAKVCLIVCRLMLLPVYC